MRLSNLLVGIYLLRCSDAAASTVIADIAADGCDFKGALSVLSVNPHTADLVDVRLMKARLLIQLERGKEAAVILDSLLLEPGLRGSDIHLLHGLALSVAGLHERAQTAFDTAVRSGGDVILVDNARAADLMRQRRNVEAEKLLLDVLERDATLTGALFNLGCLRADAGRSAEAAALIRQAWHLGLRDPEKIKNEPRLKRLLRTRDLVGDLVTATKRQCPHW